MRQQAWQIRLQLVDVLEGVQELDPVLVGLEDCLSLSPAGGNGIDVAGVFDADHGASACEA